MTDIAAAEHGNARRAAPQIGVTGGICCPAGPVTGDIARMMLEDGAGEELDLFIRQAGDGTALLNLIIENLENPAEIPRIEAAFSALSGVRDARLNGSTHRMLLRWHPDQVGSETLSELLFDLGYRAVPYDPERMADAESRRDKELLKAMAVAGFAAANVMLISVSVWAGLVQDMGPATRTLLHWLSGLIALPVIIYSGRPFFRSALAALSAGRTNMDVPISLGVILAGGMSLLETTRGGEHVYFDAAVSLLFFLLVGRYLDQSLRSRVFSAAQNLSALRSVSASVLQSDGSVVATAIEAIQPGMKVLVQTGQRIPVDGRILDGSGEVDQSLVTGESLPRVISSGDEVFAGTLNLSANLVIEVTASDEDSLLSGIAKLMAEAEQSKAGYVRIADRLAAYYAPVVHTLSAVTFLGWWLLGGLDWQSALMIAIAVLIVTCPCALGLAVPAVQVGAVGRLMKAGVLTKSGDALERLAQVDTIVFDKTGTLTVGRPVLTNKDDISDKDLALASSLAANSRHPLSRAIHNFQPDARVFPGVEEVPGCGLEAQNTDGSVIRLGKASWVAPGLEEAGGHGGPELWLRVGSEQPVRFQFQDQLRSDAKDVISALKSKGFNVELLSGDLPANVENIADQLGITAWHAAATPVDKVNRLQQLADEGRKVAMIGDGINDAPSLAAAFASLSPSVASDLSQNAADFIFQGEHLAPIVQAVEVSKRAHGLALQNFVLALSYNLLAVPIAVMGFASPLVAAVAMSTSSVIVSVNALRVRI